MNRWQVVGGILWLFGAFLYVWEGYPEGLLIGVMGGMLYMSGYIDKQKEKEERNERD